MKNLRHLLRRSGWLTSAKGRKRPTASSSEPRSGKRRLHSETLEKRQLLAGDIALAHNYTHSLDVDDNYQITARDALIVVNHLNKYGSGQEITEFDESMNYVDVNGDGMVTVNDALQVINGLQAGEGVGELVELQLNARDASDAEITPDANGDVNVTVGEVFNLELGFIDLRTSATDRLGVAKYITDISVSTNNVLVPAVGEAQRIGFSGELSDESQGTVTFRLAGGTETVEVDVADFVATRAAPRLETTAALVQLGYQAEDIQVVYRDLRDTGNRTPGEIDLFIEVTYVGEDFILTDVPGLEVTVTGTAQTVNTETTELNPLNGDGTVNGAVLPFNLITNSRTVGEVYYTDLPTGSFSETGGFDNVGGTNFDGPPPEEVNLRQFFDAVSIPVIINQPVADLVVSLNPANDETDDLDVEGVILWRDNDPVPLDMILIDEDGTLTINATAGTGFAQNGSINDGTEDTISTIDLSTLVTGAAADSFEVSTNGAIGSASISGNTLTYTPTADLNGTDSIVYTATRGTDTSTGTIAITVAAVNDAPVATDDTATTTVDTAVTIQVATLIANDSTGAANEADTLTITAVGTPTNTGATAVLNAAGTTITYTPATGSTVNDSFSYTLSDGTATTTGTVNVTVNPDAVNAPIAADGSISDAVEDTVATLDLSTLLTGGAATNIVVSTGSLGSASVSGNTLTYTPTANANGTDSIEYTASNSAGNDTGTIAITIAAVNDAPVAGNDSASTTVNTAVTIQVSDLIANDSTGAANEADTLTITAVGTPTNTGATAVLNAAGTTVTYTPAANSNTNDTFTYTLSDGTDTATGTVSVTVTGVVRPPIAGDGVINTSENTNGTIDLSTILSGGAFDPPLTITADPTSGTASITGTTLTYTPNANFNGTDTIVYRASNSIGNDSGTISITVSEVNNAPTAPSPAVTVSATEDTAVTFDAATILSNASAGAGESAQSISITAVSSTTTQSGTASVNSGGGIDYSPATDFFGSDTFTVTITDNGTPAQSVDYVVTVNVASVNDTPTAANDTAEVLQGSTVRITVLANDSAGPSNENQALTVVAAASDDGTAQINSDGTVSFTPNANFLGNATINYTVRDSDNASASASVTVNVVDFQPSTVSGAIFIDKINNFADVLPPTSAEPIRDGIKGEGEDGLSGIAVRLVPTGTTGGSTTSVITDMDGGYEFTNVAPGTYNVVYDLPDTVVFVGASTTPITIGAAGGESASGGNVGSLGLSGGLTNLDILVSSYMRANPGASSVSDGGAQGGSVGLDSNGDQTLFKAAEGFEGVDYAELTLNESRDSALLTIIEDGVARTAQLSEDSFVVSRDGTAVQFFGGKEDFEFADTLSDLVTSEFANYRNAIDRILGSS